MFRAPTLHHVLLRLRRITLPPGPWLEGLAALCAAIACTAHTQLQACNACPCRFQPEPAIAIQGVYLGAVQLRDLPNGQVLPWQLGSTILLAMKQADGEGSGDTAHIQTSIL